jgi:transcriptional regulator GlxA family with amidase domain
MKKKHRLDKAVEVLKSNIHVIKSVSDWSDHMGWERSDFSRKYAKSYGESAKRTFHKLKLETIDAYLYDQPTAKYFEVAYDLGFRDEKALYDYVRYHTNKSPGAYKRMLHENAQKGQS